MTTSPSCPDEYLTVNPSHLLQGNNCEHNYDDCLLNPCPEGFSCVDGINDVSCLPPVFLETTVRNISHSLATRDPVSVAELSAGIYERNVEKRYQSNKKDPIFQVASKSKHPVWSKVPDEVFFPEALMLTLICC